MENKTQLNDGRDWPEFGPLAEETPEEILRQWAAGLEKRTDGAVMADVAANFDSEYGLIVYKFLLKAPYMGSGGYSYVLFRVRGEGAKLYPVTIYDFEEEPEMPEWYDPERAGAYNAKGAGSAKKLKEEISRIINSRRTKAIIETLMVRSRKPSTSEKQKTE